jgi:Ca2+/H+ antiporter
MGAMLLAATSEIEASLLAVGRLEGSPLLSVREVVGAFLGVQFLAVGLAVSARSLRRR